MSFWSGEKLEEEVGNCIIGQYDVSNIDCAAYTLHVGPEIFITPDHYESKPSQNTKKTLGEKEPFNIPSGQFAFLLTEEIISVSDKCIAFISMKASTKFKGLVNISGFHVDPGYQGRLTFSVFNAGPAPIKLQRGMPLFLIWFADLDRQTGNRKRNTPVTDLDLKWLAPIYGPIFSPQAISESVKSFKEDMKSDLHKIDIKVTRVATRVNVAIPIITTLVIGFITILGGYYINHLSAEVDKLTEMNSSLERKMSEFDTKISSHRTLTQMQNKTSPASKSR